MSGGISGPRSDAVPVVTLGFLLLVAGLALLLAGDAFLSSDAASRSLWTALVGICLLLAGMVYLLLRTPAPVPASTERLRRASPAPTPAAEAPRATAPSPEVAVPAAAPVEPAPSAPPSPPAPTPVLAPVVSAEPSVRRAVALAAELPDAAPAGARSSYPTSIPAAYLQALSTTQSGPEVWSEVAPPIAAALPFSPGIRRSGDPTPPWDESSEGSEREAPRVELELARLRARVRELEVPARVAAPAPVSARLTGIPPPAKEPPTPPSRSASGPRGCVACGSGLSATGPSHLCWGCGRPLCSTCYWRFGPGPGLHRCTDCLSRAPAPESISGGRLTA